MPAARLANPVMIMASLSTVVKVAVTEVTAAVAEGMASSSCPLFEKKALPEEKVSVAEFTASRTPLVTAAESPALLVEP